MTTNDPTDPTCCASAPESEKEGRKLYPAPLSDLFLLTSWCAGVLGGIRLAQKTMPDEAETSTAMQALAAWTPGASTIAILGATWLVLGRAADIQEKRSSSPTDPDAISVAAFHDVERLIGWLGLGFAFGYAVMIATEKSELSLIVAVGCLIIFAAVYASRKCAHRKAAGLPRKNGKLRRCLSGK